MHRFWGDVTQQTSTDGLWKVLLCHLTHMGFPMVNYLHRSFESFDAAQMDLRSTMPAAWIKMAEGRAGPGRARFPMHDVPFRLHPFLHGVEFLNDYRDARFCTPRFISDVQIAGNHGFRSGVVIPLRSGLSNERASILIGGGQKREDFEDAMQRHGWTLHTAAMQFHLSYLALLRREKVAELGLTDRQLELLMLSAQGMATKEVAYKWGVTEQAVSKMMRNIIARFDVNTKIGVIAKAVKLDLISQTELDASMRPGN
ncbi:MAG: LuxR C-terminal-related transcriptional regulator [Rhodobacteraceae bacterium]|nr:LuxR C-terminal-related transcriptional regulator [Paracoccaceae bacterium]